MNPIAPADRADRADWQTRTDPPVCFHHSEPYCQLCGDIGEFRDVEYRADLPPVHRAPRGVTVGIFALTPLWLAFGWAIGVLDAPIAAFRAWLNGGAM